MEIKPTDDSFHLMTDSTIEYNFLIESVQHCLIEAACGVIPIQTREAQSLVKFLRTVTTEPVKYGVLPENLNIYRESLVSYARGLDGEKLAAATHMGAKIALYLSAKDDLQRPFQADIPESWFE